MFLLSFLLGFYPQIKPGFVGFVLVIFAVCFYQLLRMRFEIKTKILVGFLYLFLFILPFLYNLTGNQRYLQTFSLLSADNVFVRELYISLFVNKTLPNIYETQNLYPPPVWTVYAEYSIPRDGAGKKAMAEKYLRLSIEEIKKDPLKFLKWRIEKMWYVWEKHHLFPYYFDPQARLTNFLVYGGNLLLLGLFAAGLTVWIKKRGGWFAILTVFLLLYISFGHAFSITEERFSLPFYPLVCLFAGYAIWRFYYKQLDKIK